MCLYCPAQIETSVATALALVKDKGGSSEGCRSGDGYEAVSFSGGSEGELQRLADRFDA